VAFLQESHPELLQDEKFINARTQAALDIYEDIIRNGGNPLEAGHWANETLFGKLHFSKHDTLKNILWDEFLDKIPEDEAKDFAIRLLPACEEVFAQYPLTDDFINDINQKDLVAFFLPLFAFCIVCPRGFQ
jgi:hypothetical protein